jgi:hypothetical protein
LELQIIDDPGKLISLGWDSFVKNHPHATVFQSPDMYALFDATERMQPVVVGIVDESDGSLCGVLLAAIIREMNGVGGYFSSRTVVYGGPLVGKRGRGDVGILLEELIRRVRNRSIFIQFRNFFSQEDNKTLFHGQRFRYRDRMNLLVDTSSRDAVIKNMSRSRYRQVQKSLKLGACSIEPENIGQVREFYDILHDLYKYKVKKPLPGWDFFRTFYEMSKEGRLGVIRLVKYKDRIIGGILSPITPGKTIYEWYVCGLDLEYREVYPSVLATWAAIDYAIENKIQRFDFMGVGVPEREYGVRDFKMRFGGELVNYGRFARVNNRMLYSAAETGYNLLALLKKI